MVVNQIKLTTERWRKGTGTSCGQLPKWASYPLYVYASYTPSLSDSHFCVSDWHCTNPTSTDAPHIYVYNVTRFSAIVPAGDLIDALMSAKCLRDWVSDETWSLVEMLSGSWKTRGRKRWVDVATVVWWNKAVAQVHFIFVWRGVLVSTKGIKWDCQSALHRSMGGPFFSVFFFPATTYVRSARPCVVNGVSFGRSSIFLKIITSCWHFSFFNFVFPSIQIRFGRSI